jgi:hypothetical protein
MTDIDDRIRRAYGADIAALEELDHGWGNVRLGRPTVAARRRRAGARAPKLLVAIAVLVVSASSIALAQTGAIQEFISSDDRSKAADRMEVYDEPAVGTRGLSVATREMLDQMSASHTQYGTGPSFDGAELRHVLTYRDDDVTVVLRSAPSTDGQACMYFTIAARRGRGPKREHSGGGGCSLAMRYNGHVMSGTMGDYRIGRLVLGLADDAVARVRVQLSDGSVAKARLQRNGFVLRIPDYDVRPRGLLVDLDDGTTLDVGMNGCLRSQVTPPLKSRLGCGYGMNKGPSDDGSR